MRALPYRERHRACVHPETYKYFFAREAVEGVWARLVAAYGPVRHKPSVRVIEIETPRLIVRATAAGNPITVFRKRGCRDEDVAALHAVLGFPEGA